MTHGIVLVTGGAGFIGSHLCGSLLADGERVVCLDNFGSGARHNVAHLVDHDRFTLLKGDVRSPLRETFEDADVRPSEVTSIYHLASRASPDDFETHPIDIATTNGVGTLNVLRLASNVGARVLLASTSEVYGNPREHPQQESYNGNVDPRGPRACYDESKRFAESLAVAFADERGVDVRTARLFNTYGPRMRIDDGRVIPTFVVQALRGDPLTIYGDGTQTRSFLYVSDLIRAMKRLLAVPEMARTVVNLGSTDEITINELADRVSTLVGRGGGVVHKPLPEGDPSRRKPDVSRANARLGWTARVDLDEGLERTIRWYERRLDTS